MPTNHMRECEFERETPTINLYGSQLGGLLDRFWGKKLKNPEFYHCHTIVPQSGFWGFSKLTKNRKNLTDVKKPTKHTYSRNKRTNVAIPIMETRHFYIL